jgi:hypothetical protein
MAAKFFLVLLCITTTLFTSCEKDEINNKDCDRIKQAMKDQDVAAIKEIITTAINELPSREHTNENLQALVNLLRTNCSLTVDILCYGCIQTLPEQSEISLSFSSGNTTIRKVIDISAISTTNSMMKFVNMHD